MREREKQQTNLVNRSIPNSLPLYLPRHSPVYRNHALTVQLALFVQVAHGDLERLVRGHPRNTGEK